MNEAPPAEISLHHPTDCLQKLGNSKSWLELLPDMNKFPKEGLENKKILPINGSLTKVNDLTDVGV